MLTRAMRVIAGWFYTEPTNSARPRWELPVLCAIVLLGTVVRFWGLGSVGLHGEDEDTTALPAVHILQDGTPKFPSGMFYARAIVQSYLIAASVFAFGESEWAIRFPSAVCGVLLIALAYVIGRRFLNRGWNLVFVATVAFSPELIAVSQNARM